MATATVDTVDHHDDHSDDHGSSTGISNTKLAMWVFLGSECLLFGGLISTYLLYKTRRGPGPLNLTIPTDVFDISFTSVSSIPALKTTRPMCRATPMNGSAKLTYQN